MLPSFLEKPDPNIYLSDNFVVVDFETTNEDKGSAYNKKNRVVLACWYYQGKYYSQFGDIHEQETLLSHISEADFVVAHHTKFELAWLARACDVSRFLTYDTLLGDYVLNGNLGLPLDLDSCLKRRGLPSKVAPVAALIEAGVCPSLIERTSLLRYCLTDVIRAHQLLLLQRAELYSQGKLGVLFTRCIFTPVLVDLEQTGMQLDPVRVREEYGKYSAELHQVNTQLRELTGGINPKSSKQVAEFLYSKLGFDLPTDGRGNPIRTSTGKPPTSAPALSRLRARTKEQHAFLTLKQQQSNLDAAITKNLDFFLGVCDERGGLFYGRYNQSVTQTHRTSSSGVPLYLERWDKPKGVQFQNFPRKFKGLFTARKQGNLIAEVDGAQLEFRAAAYLGQDAQAISDIRNKVDVHEFTSSELTAAGQKTDRQEAKSHTFKPLYGGMSGTKAEKAYYAAFRKKYPQLAATQKDWTYEVLEHKKLRLPWGMEFFWPDTKIEGSYGYITNTQNIYNYPVQCFATAEIIPIAVTYMWYELRANNMKTFLVNTIHDSLVAELFPEERELFESLAVQCFTHRVYKYLLDVYKLNFNVPLGVGIKIGTHWGEGKEKKIDVENTL